MIGVLIITYNSRAVVGRCIDSCLQQAGVEVLVVDNASNDGTQAQILTRPGARAILNTSNRGFAGAANQGMEALQTPFVLLLNPDAHLLSGLDKLRAAFEDPAVGAAAGRMFGADGLDQSAFQLRRLPRPSTLTFEVLGLNRLWPSNPVNRRYRPLRPAEEFEQPAAAFLMVRSAAWAAVGGFDESFHPLWFEDVDFCKRLRDAGWRIVYAPGGVASHAGGHSAERLSWGQRQQFWYVSLLRYASKHFPGASGHRVVCGAAMLACFGRAVAGVISQKSWEPVVVYSKIFWIAVRCLFTGSVGRGGGAPEARVQIGGANAAG